MKWMIKIVSVVMITDVTILTQNEPFICYLSNNRLLFNKKIVLNGYKKNYSSLRCYQRLNQETIK